MDVRLLAFFGVAVILTITPGPEFALSSRAEAFFLRPSVRRIMERSTGVVLIGLGIRLAIER